MIVYIVVIDDTKYRKVQDMSKENPKYFSGIGERIAKVLIDNGIVKRDGSPNFSAAERKCKIKGTVLQRAVKRNGGLYDDNLDKFLGTFHVERQWLLHGKGEQYSKNITPVQLNADIDKDAQLIEVYKNLAIERMNRIEDLKEQVQSLKKELAECKSRK
jgi:hypothetical protein